MNRVRWRLTAWYVGVFAVILAVLGGVLYTGVARDLMAEEDEELAGAARYVAVMGGGEVPLPERDREEAFEAAWGFPHISAVLTDLEGSVIRAVAGGSPPAAPWPEGIQRARESGTGSYATIASPVGPVRVFTLPVTSGARLVAIAQAATPLGPLHHTMARILTSLAVTSVLALALAAAGGYFLASRALIPIGQALARQRNLVADASHELRTPLSIIRTGLDVLRGEAVALNAPQRETLETVAAESRRMGELLDDLLTLARADSGQLELERAERDVVPIAREALSRARVLAQEKGLEVRDRLPPSLIASVDPRRLHQLLTILLDNAVKYTDDGWVELSASADPHHLHLAVTDTGPGIPAEDRRRIFDRFYRGGRARHQTGAGLGLAIAHWIATAHGGSIAVRDGTGGRGTTFLVSLPLAPHRV